MGCQPKGMQHNFDKKPCYLCELHEYDGPAHVLFKCRNYHLGLKRNLHWPEVLSYMPQAMARCLNDSNDMNKTRFILTGLNGSYVAEWIPLYSKIMIFVTQLYSERDKLCRNLVSE